MYIIICETDRQSRFDAWYRVLRAGALGWPWGMKWGGRWEESSGRGTHVHPWLIHVNVRQKPPQYCKVVSLQLKFKKKNQFDKPVCFAYENILLSYVKKDLHLLGNLPFFKIHVNCFMAWDDSPGANVISKLHVVGEGPGASLWVLRLFLSVISRLLVAI